MARWASLVEEGRRRRPTILVDGGDFYFKAPVRFPEVNDRHLFGSMRLLGYDAVAVGENELRVGLDELLSRSGGRRPPLLLTNVVERRTGRSALASDIVKDFPGVATASGKPGKLRVGLFAVVLPAYVYERGAAARKRYAVADPREAALEAAARLRARGCHVVVAVSHLGWEGSVELAREVPGIDLVLSGHAPSRTMRVERAGGATVVETGDKERFFTEVSVVFEGDSLAVAAENRCPAALANEGDPELLEMQRRYTEETRRLRREPGRRSDAPSR